MSSLSNSDGILLDNPESANVVSQLSVSSDKGPLVWQMRGHGVSTTVPASHGHSAVAYKSCLYIYGGDVKDNKRISDVHKHSLVSGTWSKIKAKGQIPEARSGQSAVVFNGHIYIFGGRDGRTYYADLFSFCFGNRTWAKMDTRGSLVKRRYRHTAVVYGRKMYVFGGEFGSGDCYNDFYSFDFDNNTWTEVQPKGGVVPEPRSGHSAVVMEGHMYIFGGRNQDPRYFADIWRFHFESMEWSRVAVRGPSPPRTYNHSSFTYRNCLYVFGGYGSDGHNCGPGAGHRHSELYEFSFDTMRWCVAQTRGKKPSARLGHTLNLINGSLYLYGGWDRNGYRSDLHFIHFDDVRMDLRGLLKNPKLAEVELLVEDEAIPVHLVILSARCPKLLEWIQAQRQDLPGPHSGGKTLEVQGGQSSAQEPAEEEEQTVLSPRAPARIPLPQAQVSTFNLLLDYIYSGALPNDPVQSVYLREYATHFGLERCSEAATYHIKQNLSQGNVLAVLQAADACREEDVKTYALAFIADNYDEVVCSENMKTLKQELLVELLQVPTKSFKTRSRAMVTRFEELSEVIAPSELKEALLGLVGQAAYSDIRFVVEGHTIPAHHCILHSRHPTFTRLWFDTGMQESRTRQVVIEDVERDVWLQLLRFLYTGTIDLLSLDEALKLITVADQYLLDSLKSHCENFVTTCLQPANVLSVLNVANSCRLPQLKDLCLDLLSNNFSMLAKNETALHSLTGDLLVQIITAHARTCSHTFPEP